MNWGLRCGPPLPWLTDENVAEIEAHWDAYRDSWVDSFREQPTNWREVVALFEHLDRKEEFLASALLKIAQLQDEAIASKYERDA